MSTETVSAEAAEVAAEVAEDVVEDVVEMVEVVRNNPVVLSIVGVLGLAAGAAGGYFVARKILREHYSEIAEREILEAKEFYAGFNKVKLDGSALTPQEVLAESMKTPEGQAAVSALREYSGLEVETPAETEEELLERRVTEARVTGVSLEQEADPSKGVHPITEVHREETTRVEVEPKQEESVNVFVDPTFDLAEEVKHRTKDRPYVISHDEYFGAEHEEYDTIQLTYFEGDDVLVGENDQVINDVDGTIGDESLARFGHGSKDKKIVYVRNDKLMAEYEVSLSDQSYLEALGLGPEKEIRHSNRNAQLSRRREFRRGDG